jgi:hypothetical protein
VALITLAGRPKSEGSSGAKPRNFGDTAPDVEFERHYLPTPLNSYAMCAMRHCRYRGGREKHCCNMSEAHENPLGPMESDRD